MGRGERMCWIFLFMTTQCFIGLEGSLTFVSKVIDVITLVRVRILDKSINLSRGSVRDTRSSHLRRGGFRRGRESGAVEPRRRNAAAV